MHSAERKICFPPRCAAWEMDAMNRLQAALVLVALWAAIYLPGLGSTELKGEEGRRILPAVTMLETGDWLVPYVGGKPFLRKPPLINWLIAGSFSATGVRTEWTARLPSALCVLALGLTIVALGRGWMNPDTALGAAIMAMTSFGLLAKARFAGAEIEGVYVPLAGIAMVMWMAWWTQRRSPWLTWVVPWVFLGLAALAKGPMHLLFFYAILLSVLWRAKAWREFFHPAHFLGLAVMVGIFATWAIPYFQTESASNAAGVWRDQMANRVTDNAFDWKSYALNLPRGLLDQMPWLLFAPAVFAVRSGDGRRGALIHGARLATIVCFVALILIPGVLPRYVLPLALPWSVLVALALEGTVRRLTLWVAAILAGTSCLYAGIAVPLINRRDNIRPVAAQIDASIPAGHTLVLYDPGYLPEIFYLRTACRYAPYMEDVPAGAAFVLARGAARKRIASKRPDLIVTQTFKSKRGGELLLLQPRAAVREDAGPAVEKPGAPL